MEEPWSGNLKASVSKESSSSHLCHFQQAGLSISVSSSEHGRAGDNIQTSTSAGDCSCQGHMQLTGNLEIAPVPLCEMGNLPECPEMEITHLSLLSTCLSGTSVDLPYDGEQIVGVM